MVSARCVQGLRTRMRLPLSSLMTAFHKPDPTAFGLHRNDFRDVGARGSEMDFVRIPSLISIMPQSLQNEVRF